MNEDLRRSSPLPDARAGDDAGIPVLTERLVLPALEIDVSLPPPAVQPEPVAEPVVAVTEADLDEPPAPLAPSPEPQPLIDTAALTAQVREEAIARLQTELAPALEAAVRQRVAAAVDDALLDMLALLQVSLESQVRNAVQTALDEQFQALREPPR